MTQSKSERNLTELKEKTIGKLILQYALPNILGLAFFALYIIVLQIFIAYGSGLGVHAVGGVGICLPVIFFLFAISMLTGIGAGSHISICLGKKDKETACRLLGNAVTLSVILSLAFTLLFLLFFEPLLRLIGTSSENYQYVKDFLIIYIPSAVIIVLTSSLNHIIRASGYPKKAMLLLFFGLMLNIVITPIILFVWKGGIKGVAAGMVFCQLLTLLPSVSHFLKKDNPLHFRIQSLHLNLHVTKMIVSIGFSPFLVNSSMTIIAFFTNNRLMTYGSTFAIDTYTISNSFVTFVVLLLLGLSQGIQPILGYNHGAEKIDRIFETLKIACSTGVMIGLAGLAAARLFSYPFATMLSPDNKLVAPEVVRCLQFLSIGLPLSGFQMIVTSFFQSIGSAGKAFMLSFTRQFVFLVPALFIFPLFWQTRGIWYALPVSDVSSTLLAGIFFMFQLKKLRRRKRLI